MTEGTQGMQYVVHCVDEHELPEGVEYVIVERPEPEPAVLLLAGSVARCWELMRRWEDTLEPSNIPSISVPYLHAVG